MSGSGSGMTIGATRLMTTIATNRQVAIIPIRLYDRTARRDWPDPIRPRAVRWAAFSDSEVSTGVAISAAPTLALDAHPRVDPAVQHVGQQVCHDHRRRDD